KVFVNRKRFQFCLRGKGGSSFESIGLCLDLWGLQMCLHLCVGYLLLTSFQNFDSLLLSITPSYFNNSSIGTTSLHALDCACLVCLFSIVSIIPKLCANGIISSTTILEFIPKYFSSSMLFSY